jgi:hypothetical protein
MGTDRNGMEMVGMGREDGARDGRGRKLTRRRRGAVPHRVESERERRKPFRSISEGRGSEMGHVMAGIQSFFWNSGRIPGSISRPLQTLEYGSEF